MTDTLDSLRAQNAEQAAEIEKLKARAEAAEARCAELEKALREVDECFEAAVFEGWVDALANGDIDAIRDLFERRISFARTSAIAALGAKP